MWDSKNIKIVEERLASIIEKTNVNNFAIWQTLKDGKTFVSQLKNQWRQIIFTILMKAEEDLTFTILIKKTFISFYNIEVIHEFNDDIKEFNNI